MKPFENFNPALVNVNSTFVSFSILISLSTKKVFPPENSTVFPSVFSFTFIVWYAVEPLNVSNKNKVSFSLVQRSFHRAESFESSVLLLVVLFFDASESVSMIDSICSRLLDCIPRLSSLTTAINSSKTVDAEDAATIPEVDRKPRRDFPRIPFTLHSLDQRAFAGKGREHGALDVIARDLEGKEVRRHRISLESFCF